MTNIYMTQKADWSAIYCQEFIYVDTCWKTCGSYCCKNFYGDNFNLLNKKNVILPLIESEYRYFESTGGISNIKEKPVEQKYSLDNGVEISVFFLSCQCGGVCSPHAARPFICRIYPFFPIVDDTGTITGFDNAALIDMLFNNPAKNHPCTLVRTQREQIEHQLRQSLQPFTRNPEIVFFLKVLELIAVFLRKKITACVDEAFAAGEERAFFKKYEWNVFSRKPWTNRDFREQVQLVYDRLDESFGVFL